MDKNVLCMPLGACNLDGRISSTNSRPLINHLPQIIGALRQK